MCADGSRRERRPGHSGTRTVVTGETERWCVDTDHCGCGRVGSVVCGLWTVHCGPPCVLSALRWLQALLCCARARRVATRMCTFSETTDCEGAAIVTLLHVHLYARTDS